MDQAEYERRKSELNRQLRDFSNRLNTANNSISTCRSEIQTLENNIRTYANQLSDTNAQINQTEKDINTHQLLLSQVKKASQALRATVADKKTRANAVSVYAKSVSFARTYFDEMNGRLTGSEHTRVSLGMENAQVSVNKKISSLNSERDSLKARARNLEAGLTDAKNRIALLNSHISGYERERRSHQSTISQINQQLQQLERQRSLG